MITDIFLHSTQVDKLKKLGCTVALAHVGSKSSAEPQGYPLYNVKPPKNATMAVDPYDTRQGEKPGKYQWEHEGQTITVRWCRGKFSVPTVLTPNGITRGQTDHS